MSVLILVLFNVSIAYKSILILLLYLLTWTFILMCTFPLAGGKRKAAGKNRSGCRPGKKRRKKDSDDDDEWEEEEEASEEVTDAEEKSEKSKSGKGKSGKGKSGKGKKRKAKSSRNDSESSSDDTVHFSSQLRQSCIKWHERIDRPLL